MKTRPGFTVLEMTVAMIVVSIMMSIAFTSARTLRHRAEVRGSADRYAAKHSLARAIAVRSGRTTVLRVDTVGRRVWVEVQRAPTVFACEAQPALAGKSW